MVVIKKPETMEFLLVNSKKNGRSISGEINYLIERGVAEVIKEAHLLESIKKGNSQFDAEFGKDV